MSFNRANYDTCQYKQTLSESTGPGYYMINKPPVSCEQCYPFDPSIRLQESGNSVDANISRIDIDSELINITRPYSKCPSKKWIASCPNKDNDNLKHWKDCMFPTEETRTSNPACNLRGTGWNRWEWLCLNPQERVEIPFDYNIDNRIIVKDNHRPCIPTPIDNTTSLPIPKELPCEITESTCGNFTHAPSVQWRSCSEIKNY